MVSGLFVVIGPAEEVSVVPGAGGDFETEGETAGVPSANDDDGGNADLVDPAGFAVRTAADAAVLGHGFVGRRHLRCGVNIAVEVKAVESGEIEVEGLSAGFEVVGLGERVGLDEGLGLCSEAATVFVCGVSDDDVEAEGGRWLFRILRRNGTGRVRIL